MSVFFNWVLFFKEYIFLKPGCCSQREAGLVDKVRSVSPPGTGSAQRSTCKTMYLNYPITQKFLKILFTYFSFWTTWTPLSLNSFSPQLRALQGTLAGGGADGRSIETSLCGCNWDIFWKLSKTKIYIKILLLWVQFKHRVGKIAHRAHWSRGNAGKLYSSLFKWRKENLHRMEAKHSHLTKMQELEVSPLCPWVKKMMIDDFKKMSIGGKVTSQPYQPVDKLRKRRLRPEFRKSDQLDKKVMSSPYKSPPTLLWSMFWYLPLFNTSFGNWIFTFFPRLLFLICCCTKWWYLQKFLDISTTTAVDLYFKITWMGTDEG